MKRKSKNTKLAVPALAYEDRAAMANREAAVIEIETINRVWKKFDATAKSIEANTVESANLARELGLHLQILCGHDQLDLGFWQTRLADKLPFPYKSAKIFVAVANRMTEPAKTLQDAAQFVQQLLIANGSLQLAERTEAQTASVISVFQRFLAEITLERALFKKVLKEQPMESWTASQHDSFAADCEWLRAELDRSAKLRHKLYGN